MEPGGLWLGGPQAWLPPPGTWETKGNWLGRAGGNHVFSQLWLGLVGRGLERPLTVWELMEGGSGRLGPGKAGWVLPESPCGGGGVCRCT